MEADLGLQAVWARDQVREILREADPRVWQAERAEELRRRVRDLVAKLRAQASDESTASAFMERLRQLGAAMERALPDESTRARWAAFVGAVSPEYEALVAALPKSEPAPHRRPANYARSALHFSSAAVGVLCVAYLQRSWLIGIAVVFAFYAWAMEAGRRVSPRLNERLMRFYSSVAHTHEYYRVNSGTWYATALVILAVLSVRPASMAALAVLGVADPVAAFVGRRWGKHKIRTGRSLEGTLAFVGSASVAAAIALAWAGVRSPGEFLALTAISAVAGALAELVTESLDDNLTIPVTVGAVATAAIALGI
ncbi:MAG TPA: hypothetical protein VGI39_14310 [Polyangiaceae bacterium]